MTKLLNLLPLQKRLPAYSLFLTLGAFVTLAVMLSSPSDPKNAFFLGYSLERILLSLGVFISGIALLFLTLILFRAPERSQRLWGMFTLRGRTGDISFVFAVFVLLAGWVLTFLPSYRLGRFSGYVERLSPIIVWLAVVGAVTIAIILLERMGTEKSLPGENRLVLKVASIFGGGFALFALIVTVTGIGVRYPEDYWFGSGVPILGLQVLLSLFAGAAFIFLEKRFAFLNKKNSDIFIFIIIWLIAAWFWGREPLVPNYFMPDTADNVIYPYSDGATFDTGAQYALIGQGLFSGGYFERVLYSVLLTYLHALLGQDVSLLLMAQAALFAVFPAVIYLLGRELHSRAFGISAGTLLAIRGVNSIIAAKWIDTASPKMMLTDFPTALGIAILLLLLVKWIKEPSRMGTLAWAGAVFGLTLSVRTNVLPVLPVVLVFIPWLMKLRWRQIALTVIFVAIGFLAVTLPWELRNQSRGYPMYSAYYSRIIWIMRSRYGIGGDIYLSPQYGAFTGNNNEISTRGLMRQRAVEVQSEKFCDSLLCEISNHFAHNIVTSFTSLPASFVFDDIWNTVKADTPYWKSNWNDGKVGTIGVILILLNLVLTSLGVGSIWSRSRALTLLPILVFAAYLFTNSIGLTSGGRYVAPVDWIVYLFYIAGGFQLVSWFLRASGFIGEPESVDTASFTFPALRTEKFSKTLLPIVFILMVGSLLPVSEAFFTPRYQVRSPQEILSQLDESGFLEQTGYSQSELLDFLAQPNAMIREGRALYPRFYPRDEGEPDRSTYYRYLEYPRLVITLIGPYAITAEGVVIPGFAPPISFHAADVVVLGCWNTTYYAPFIDAVMVISTSGDGYVYNRAPESPLECPLQTP